MSTWTVERLRCPACGATFRGELLNGMHITRLPQAKEMLLDGTLHRFTCPDEGCAHAFRVERTAIYTDFDDGRYLAIEKPHEPDVRTLRTAHAEVFEACFSFGPPAAERLGWGLTHRLVFGYEAAREKLLIWDLGLDDRVVEAVKADLLREQWLAPDGPGPRPWQLRLDADIGGNLLFKRSASRHSVLARSADGSLTARPLAVVDYHTVPRAAVATRAEDPESISRDYPWLMDGWVVDATFGAPT
jgi:hypothetical protein